MSALGIEVHVRGSLAEGDLRGNRVGPIAVFNGHEQLTAARVQLPGQGEFHPQLAAIIGLGDLLKDSLGVYPGCDLQGNSGSRFAIGPFEEQVRGHVIARAIAVAGKFCRGLKMGRSPSDHFKSQALLGKSAVETSRHQRVRTGGQRIAQSELAIADTPFGEAGHARVRQRDRLGIEDFELHGQRARCVQTVAQDRQRAIVNRFARSITAAVEPESRKIMRRPDGQRKCDAQGIRARAGGDRKLGRPVRSRGKVHVGRHEHSQPALVVGVFFAIQRTLAVGRGERPFHGACPRLAGNRGGQQVVRVRHPGLQLSRSGHDKPQMPGRDRVQLPAMVEVAAQRDCD